MRPEDTQKIVIGSSTMSKMLLLLLSAIATIIAWLGTNLISKVDALASNFGGYTVVMERRVTLLEEQEKNVNYRLDAMQSYRDQRAIK